MAKATKTLNKATSAKPVSEVTDRVPDAPGLDRLSDEMRNLAGATATWALSSALNKIDGLTDRLSGDAPKAGPGALAGGVGSGGGLVKNLVKKVAGAGFSAITGKQGGPGKRGGGKQPKVTNIVETIDVGGPVRLVYDQWTRFTEFPRFTKKVEDVAQEADEKLVWRAKVFWSRRSWESTIIEQVPDQRIIWRSKGAKGHVDGAVTFHELAPELTRIVLVLEYHPQGLFERTGNIWRAQGRRARLELKHFRRHVMTQSLLHPDEIEGWRGEIRDGEVVAEDERDEDEADRSEEETDQGDDQADQDEIRDDEIRDDEVQDEEVQDEDEDVDRPRPARAKGKRTAGGRTSRSRSSTRKPAASKRR